MTPQREHSAICADTYQLSGCLTNWSSMSSERAKKCLLHDSTSSIIHVDVFMQTSMNM